MRETKLYLHGTQSFKSQNVIFPFLWSLSLCDLLKKKKNTDADKETAFQEEDVSLSFVVKEGVSGGLPLHASIIPGCWELVVLQDRAGMLWWVLVAGGVLVTACAIGQAARANSGWWEGHKRLWNWEFAGFTSKKWRVNLLSLAARNEDWNKRGK